jgi:hypothetical protein
MKIFTQKLTLPVFNGRSKFGLTLMTLLFCLNGISQDNDALQSPNVFERNSFGITLTNGFNKTAFESENGVGMAESRLGYVPKIHLDYRFSLGQYFGINVGAGVVFFPFAYEIEPRGDFLGTSEYTYFNTTNYNAFGSFRTSLDFNYWINPKFGFTAAAGAGFWSVPFRYTDLGIVGENGTDGRFLITTLEGLRGNLHTTIGVNYKLKNDHVLNASLTYEYLHDKVYSGDYVIYNGSADGTFLNEGNTVNLSVSYIFTRTKKRKNVNDMKE